MTVRGQTLVIVAVCLIPMGLLFVAGLQLGMARTWHAQAQGVADFAALAGASGWVDGDRNGDSARARAQQIVDLNLVAGAWPQSTITTDRDSGTVTVRIWQHTPPLLLRPKGITVSAIATAQASLKDSTDVTPGGRPMPPGHAYGWEKQRERRSPGFGTDTALLRLRK